jgi:hypothetical protein
MDTIAEAIVLMIHDVKNQEKVIAMVKELTEKYPLDGAVTF